MKTKRIDLNQADQESLATLPGIGSELAARIVRHREKSGPFENVAEMEAISGMSYEKVQAIQDLVTIDSSQIPESEPATIDDTLVRKERIIETDIWQVNGYRLDRRIAVSSQADVYVAYELENNDAYQIEIFHGNFNQDSEIVQAYSWSILFIGSLKNPNIVRIHKLGITESGHLYLVRPYFEGQSLSGYIRLLAGQDEKTSPVEGLLLARQIAEALSEAHRNFVFHKDLTANNIILQTDLSPLLLGLDTPDLERTASHKDLWLAARIPYLSPEQLEGGALDGRSNVYSLGVILYEFLAGQPFGVMGQEPAHMGNLKQIRPDLTDHTYSLVSSCIQLDAGDRFQSMQDLIIAIGSAVDAEICTEAGMVVAPLSANQLAETVGREEVAGRQEFTYAQDVEGIRWRRYFIRIALILFFLFIVVFGLSSLPSIEPSEGRTTSQNESSQGILPTMTIADKGSLAPTLGIFLTAQVRLSRNAVLIRTTPILLSTPSDTPSPTPTDTPTATPTNTSTSTPTDTPTATPTDTPTATRRVPTATNTPTPPTPTSSSTSPPPQPTSPPPPTQIPTSPPPTKTPPRPG